MIERNRTKIFEMFEKKNVFVKSVENDVIKLKIIIKIIEKIITYLNRNVLNQIAINHFKKIKNNEILIVKTIN